MTKPAQPRAPRDRGTRPDAQPRCRGARVAGRSHATPLPEEKRILDFREQGGRWTEIAEELGSSPEAIRKRLARAVDRVAHELGLDESP